MSPADGQGYHWSPGNKAMNGKLRQNEGDDTFQTSIRVSCTDATNRLRDALLIFFLYHFQEVDRIVDACNSVNNRRAGVDAYRHARTQYSLICIDCDCDFVLRTRFLDSRSTAGDGSAVITFMREFVHSQMFERLCESSAQNCAERPMEQSDSFNLCRKALRSADLAPSVPNLQKIVRSGN